MELKRRSNCIMCGQDTEQIEKLKEELATERARLDKVRVLLLGVFAECAVSNFSVAIEEDETNHDCVLSSGRNYNCGDRRCKNCFTLL